MDRRVLIGIGILVILGLGVLFFLGGGITGNTITGAAVAPMTIESEVFKISDFGESGKEVEKDGES